MKPVVGKRRTREHVIADLSVCFVEWQALRCGYTVQRTYHDYGIDLELRTYSEIGEREPGGVLFQVKATDGLAIRDSQADIPFRIQRADLVLWLSELMPVILIVFDAKKTGAYWLCIQDYFDALEGFNLFAAGTTITVHVPLANRVNNRAMRKFAKLRDEYRKRPRRPDHD